MDSIERWRPVVGFEGSYEVSDHGRVRSLDRVLEHSGPQGRRFQTFRTGQMLANCVHSNGYHQVWVRNAAIPGQRRRKAFVHLLVATAFLGERTTPEMEVCHGDGNPANNHLDNLRWDTATENKLDMVRHGRHAETKRDCCRHGHLFAGANLGFKQGRGGRLARKCVSCSYGHGRVRNNSSRDVRAEADRRYISLGFGAPEEFGEGVNQRSSA